MNALVAPGECSTGGLNEWESACDRWDPGEGWSCSHIVARLGTQNQLLIDDERESAEGAHIDLVREEGHVDERHRSRGERDVVIGYIVRDRPRLLILGDWRRRNGSVLLG